MGAATRPSSTGCVCQGGHRMAHSVPRTYFHYIVLLGLVPSLGSPSRGVGGNHPSRRSQTPWKVRAKGKSQGLSDTQNTTEARIRAQLIRLPGHGTSALHLRSCQDCGIQLELKQISIPRKCKLSVPTGPFSSHSHKGWMMS